MRWSIEELFKAWKYQFSFLGKHWTNIIKFPPSLWRSFKATVHWIFTGYCWEMMWNLDSTMIDIITFRLLKFKGANQMSYPCDFKSHEEWHAVIDDIVDKFDKMKNEYYTWMIPASKMIIHEDTKTITFDRQDGDKEISELCYRAQAQNDKEALELFGKYFQNLWD